MSHPLIHHEGRYTNARQRFFIRYFTLVLVDLVVLNLFEEYWAHVSIPSFTVSLGAALLLQVMMKLTIALEHRVSAFFESKSHPFAKLVRILALWLVLFGSKFVFLWALHFTFGEQVVFSGPLHGVVALIVVLLVMILAEVLVARFTEFLRDKD